MKVEERKSKVYISYDGKKFKSRKACEKWEIENVAGVKDSRIRELLEELQCFKRSGGWESLRRSGERLRKAKLDLLKAAKGKRRYTLQFATIMAKACEEYINAHGRYEAGLQRYRDTLAELKQIEPRFDRSKKGLAK